MKRIGILGSGGDAPGMNAALRGATRAVIDRECQVVGVWDGYNGLVDHRLEELGSRSVSGILQRGGCMIGAGRCESFFDPAVRQACAEYLKSEGVEGLIVIGGDGSLQGALALEALGVPTVTIPGTIDNDMPGTAITIGADTAVNTAMEAIDRLRDTAAAHQRAAVVEVMGRHCGWIAVMVGIATGAEMILTPERPTRLDDLFDEMRKAREQGKRHFIIVLAEGAEWRAPELTRLINEAPNRFEARHTVLGYVQRGGSPSRFDRMLATRMGVEAVDALLSHRTGTLVAWRNNEIQVLPAANLPPRRDPWDGMVGRVHRVTTL